MLAWLGFICAYISTADGVATGSVSALTTSYHLQDDKAMQTKKHHSIDHGASRRMMRQEATSTSKQNATATATSITATRTLTNLTSTSTTPNHESLIRVARKPLLITGGRHHNPVADAEYSKPATNGKTANVTTACDGVQGMWVRNEDPLHHPPLNYTIKELAGAAQARFKPTAKQPYREATLWDWQPAGGCELTRLNRSTFCSAMSQAGLNRLMLVGDSLSWMMMLSLWKLLGGQTDPPSQWTYLISNSTAMEPDLMTDEAETQNFEEFADRMKGSQEVGMQMRTHILCDNQKSIELGFHRSDLLEEEGRASHWSDGWGTAKSAWGSDYLKDIPTTLLLVNAGLHVHGSESYRQVIDNFRNFITGLSSSKPKVVFRASAPGHVNCESYTKPVRSAADVKFTSEETKNFSWDLVPQYNNYVKDVVGQMQSEGVDISVLDVYPMTVTRPDGHRWDKDIWDRQGTKFGPGHHFARGDCLHYYLPGVPDWWNHLLLRHMQTHAGPLVNRRARL